MARTEIPVTHVSRATLVAAPVQQTADPTNDNFVKNDGGTFLRVVNGNVASRTFDVQLVISVDDTQSVTPRTYTVAGSGTGYTGVFPREFYGETILIDTATTDLSFAAFSLL